jgi:hypothetical protein
MSGVSDYVAEGLRDLRVLAVLALAACAHGPPMYPVPAPPLDDDAGFARLAAAMRTAYERDVVRSPAHAQHDLFELALLDALDGDRSTAIARLDRSASLVDDPGDRAMLGLTIRVWADGGDRAAIERQIARLPHPGVERQLATLHELVGGLTPDVSHAAIAELVGSAREVSLDTAEAIVFQRWFVRHVATHAADYDAVLSRERRRRTSGSSPPGTPAPSGSPAAAGGDR